MRFLKFFRAKALLFTAARLINAISNTAEASIDRALCLALPFFFFFSYASSALRPTVYVRE